MAHTIAAPHVRRPNRRAPVRVLVADALRSAADRIASYREGDPSPCCGADGERLYESPWLPGFLVCPADDGLYPAAPR
jgi:hypothetical protein